MLTSSTLSALSPCSVMYSLFDFVQFGALMWRVPAWARRRCFGMALWSYSYLHSPESSAAQWHADRGIFFFRVIAIVWKCYKQRSLASPEEWNQLACRSARFRHWISNEWMPSVACTYCDMFYIFKWLHPSPLSKGHRSLGSTLHHRWQRVLFRTVARARGS